MNYLSVTKFDKHQHYKRRNPPWIKLYVTLLDVGHPINDLPVPARYLFDRMLLLASVYANAIPNDCELIAKLTRMDPEQCRESLDQLLKGRWIKVTNTPRRASKVASKPASANRAPENREQRHKEHAHARENVKRLEPIPHRYQCPYCTLTSKTSEDLEAHVENMHQGVAIGTIG